MLDLFKEPIIIHNWNLIRDSSDYMTCLRKFGMEYESKNINKRLNDWIKPVFQETN